MPPDQPRPSQEPHPSHLGVTISAASAKEPMSYRVIPKLLSARENIYITPILPSLAITKIVVETYPGSARRSRGREREWLLLYKLRCDRELSRFRHERRRGARLFADVCDLPMRHLTVAVRDDAHSFVQTTTGLIHLRTFHVISVRQVTLRVKSRWFGDFDVREHRAESALAAWRRESVVGDDKPVGGRGRNPTTLLGA